MHYKIDKLTAGASTGSKFYVMQGQNEEKRSYNFKGIFIQLQVVEIVHYYINIFIDVILYDATNLDVSDTLWDPFSIK